MWRLVLLALLAAPAAAEVMRPATDADLAAALARAQAADAALVELGTLPPADMVATIRLRATGEPS